jgi:hypothetical protein
MLLLLPFSLIRIGNVSKLAILNLFQDSEHGECEVQQKDQENNKLEDRRIDKECL